MEQTMKLLLTTAAVAIGLAVAPAAYAQQPTAPGQLLQGQGSVKGSGGAATTAPGRVQGDSSTQGTVGASGSAPGRVGAGVDAATGANVKAGGAKATGGAKAKTGVGIR
jgi:hypothetical protein